MKNMTKAALFAAAALAAVSPAHAYTTGDLILGFTSGGGNDYITDLGQVSSLFNGESWNLNSQITGNFAGSLNNLQFGIIAGKSGTIYSTVALGQVPPGLSSLSAYNTANAGVGAIGAGFGGNTSYTPSSGDANSWYQQTINGSGNAQFVNAYNNPNSPTPANFTSGSVPADFYAAKGDGTDPVQLGTFNFSSQGTLTFGAVPEPSTCMLGGLGLLAFALSRRIFGKA
jgi:hypothetical protein